MLASAGLQICEYQESFIRWAVVPILQWENQKKRAQQAEFNKQKAGWKSDPCIHVKKVTSDLCRS